ncbi:hypothetical protein ABB37_08269 [Leptomonas pyrrhocoris]|uniref:Uncharacterized protein n=1 Tax=Leptomonas pyrrhocoris TaxID=157538 RepID=A0A0N0VDI2_LEPPY|nr:hypothetical protein ABB37_08269 [Leptomonas pyrrhocoris]XP_015654161.1 hypothetical protein ABB37_08269 [Leptomonas pyrrhocoris]KPA75721.1 hypothetical protein ABB37_08269 [Leptomonas pyrrhocoris]KPA75722.1 hypothetical protein ABB37_08269 [Leptomonas pyrrhocoris]|eukprot:XP_015654160.1 hypothetical protein ABB37_08269 [Leptomonas pyrrhocoris]
MYTTLGLSAEQVYGDMYAAWLRDTHEKNSTEVKRLYTAMIDKGFGNQQVLLRRQRLGANFINSLVPLLHQSTLVKLDLHGNVLRDVGCELLVQVVRDMPHLTYLDMGANALGNSSTTPGGAGGRQATRGTTGAAESALGGGSIGLLSRTNGGGGGGRGGGGSNAARTGSRYLSAMQGLGTAIAQHKKLSVLILGSAKEESYANQIEEVGAVCILEGCVLSRTLKRLDFSGNPFAVNCVAPVEVARRSAGEGADGSDSANGGRGGGVGADSPAAGGARNAGRPRNSGAASAAATTPANAEEGRSSQASNVHKRMMMGGGGGGYGTRSGPRTPVELLAQLFRTSTTLTHARLRAVGLSDGGAAYLLDAAGASNTLLRLDMSENGLSSSVAEAAGLLLQQRTAIFRTGGKGCALQSLVLSDNDLRDNGAAATQARRGSFGFNSSSAGGGGEKSRFASSAPPTTTSGSRYVNRTRALHQGTAPTAPSPSSLSPSSAGGSCAAFYAASAAQPNAQCGMLLFFSLGKDPLLTALVLDNCALDDTALFALCRSLLTNVSLTVLSLKDNQFSPDGAVQLGRALCRHPCLEKLFLSGNAIEDEGVCALATALGYPDATLIELDVARTWLGDRGLIALGVALQTNTSLQVLHVADNHFTQDGGASFAALFDNNRHVVRCELSGTSVPHHVVLRLKRATARNRKKAGNATSDALQEEVVRLHYQMYKLSEAQLELEALREKNAEVKRTTESFDLQTKQGHSDFVKRIRELEDQIGNAKEQEVRYGEQTAKLEADLLKAQEAHADDMAFAAERLAAEAKLREEAEAKFHQTQLELEDWRMNGASREAKKREHLAEMKADQEAWSSQRKEYKELAMELQRTVAELEAAAAAAKTSTSGKKGKKGKKS